MKCENCGIEMTSEKIFALHLRECKKIEQKQVGLEDMGWKELVKYASEQGINTKGKKKQELLNELKVVKQ